MKKLETIVCDADDTLVRFNKGINDYINKVHGRQHNLSDYNTYNLEQVWGLNYQETFDIVHGFYQTPGYRTELETYEEARYILPMLAKKYRIVLATARPWWHQSFTQEFLDRDFPGVFSGNFHIANLPADSQQPRTKVEVCQREGAKYLIDDAPHHILGCAEIGVQGLLLDTPWNKDVSHPLVTRVKNWHDIGHHLL